jgi:N-dimethylarginine dimethylaminohydrolase
MTWQVNSEAGVLTDVLLCRPNNYNWIATNAIVERTPASGRDLFRFRPAAEFRELENALEHAGVRPHDLSTRPHLPYQA